MKPVAALLLVIAVMLPGVQAGEGRDLAMLGSDSVEVEGSGAIGAGLRAVAVPPAVADVLPPVVSLDAERMDVVSDRLRTDMKVGSTVSYGVEYDTLSATLQNASIDSAGARQGHMLYILSTESATVRTDAAGTGMKPAATRDVTVPDRISHEGPGETRSLVDAVRLTQSGQERLVIEGDFLIVAWELDLLAQHADGEETVWSGERHYPVAPGLPGATTGAAGQSEARQVYITVHDGRLTLDGLDPSRVAIHVDDVVADIDGAVTFTDASGDLSDGEGFRAIDGEDLRIEGRLRVTATGESDHIRSTAAGDVSSARIGTQQASWVSPYDPGGQESLRILPWFGVMVVVVMGGLGVLPANRRRVQRRRMASAEALYEMGHYEEAVPRARRLRRSRTFGPDALLMEAESMARIGQTAEAAALLERCGARLDPAVRRYAQALIHALDGDGDAARADVQAMVEHDPLMLAGLLEEPLLAPFVRRRGGQEAYT